MEAYLHRQRLPIYIPLTSVVQFSVTTFPFPLLFYSEKDPLLLLLFAYILHNFLAMDAPSATPPWEVSLFEIKTEAGRSEDRLYANGRMQLKLNVFIKARVPTGDPDSPHSPYQLTTEELHSISMVGLNREPFPSREWWWTTKKNEFANALPGDLKDGLPEASSEDGKIGKNPRDDPQPQLVELYTMTNKIEVKAIVARIQQPNGDYAYSTDANQGRNSGISADLDITSISKSANCGCWISNKYLHLHKSH